MDEYGFCATAMAAIELFEINARNSGRSSRLIEHAAPGDIIIVINLRDAQFYRDAIKRAGKRDVAVRVVETSPHSVAHAISPGRAAGRVFFDHSWQREFYLAELRTARRKIEHMQKELSATWPGGQGAGDKSALRIEGFARGMGFEL